MPTGKIIRMIRDRGFGFIKSDEDGNDYFFHHTALHGTDYQIEFDSLAEGQRVRFEIGIGPNGRPQAIKVKLPPPEIL